MKMRQQFPNFDHQDTAADQQQQKYLCRNQVNLVKQKIASQTPSYYSLDIRRLQTQENDNLFNEYFNASIDKNVYFTTFYNNFLQLIIDNEDKTGGFYLLHDSTVYQLSQIQSGLCIYQLQINLFLNEENKVFYLQYSSQNLYIARLNLFELQKECQTPNKMSQNQYTSQLISSLQDYVFTMYKYEKGNVNILSIMQSFTNSTSVFLKYTFATIMEIDNMKHTIFVYRNLCCKQQLSTNMQIKHQYFYDIRFIHRYFENDQYRNQFLKNLTNNEYISQNLFIQVLQKFETIEQCLELYEVLPSQLIIEVFQYHSCELSRFMDFFTSSIFITVNEDSSIYILDDEDSPVSSIVILNREFSEENQSIYSLTDNILVNNIQTVRILLSNQDLEEETFNIIVRSQGVSNILRIEQGQITNYKLLNYENFIYIKSPILYHSQLYCQYEQSLNQFLVILTSFRYTAIKKTQLQFDLLIIQKQIWGYLQLLLKDFQFLSNLHYEIIQLLEILNDIFNLPSFKLSLVWDNTIFLCSIILVLTQLNQGKNSSYEVIIPFSYYQKKLDILFNGQPIFFFNRLQQYLLSYAHFSPSSLQYFISCLQQSLKVIQNVTTVLPDNQSCSFDNILLILYTSFTKIDFHNTSITREGIQKQYDKLVQKMFLLCNQYEKCTISSIGLYFNSFFQYFIMLEKRSLLYQVTNEAQQTIQMITFNYLFYWQYFRQLSIQQIFLIEQVIDLNISFHNPEIESSYADILINCLKIMTINQKRTKKSTLSQILSYQQIIITRLIKLINSLYQAKQKNILKVIFQLFSVLNNSINFEEALIIVKDDQIINNIFVTIASFIHAHYQNDAKYHEQQSILQIFYTVIFKALDITKLDWLSWKVKITCLSVIPIAYDYAKQDLIPLCHRLLQFFLEDQQPQPHNDVFYLVVQLLLCYPEENEKSQKYLKHIDVECLFQQVFVQIPEERSIKNIIQLCKSITESSFFSYVQKVTHLSYLYYSGYQNKDNMAEFFVLQIIEENYEKIPEIVRFYTKYHHYYELSIILVKYLKTEQTVSKELKCLQNIYPFVGYDRHINIDESMQQYCIDQLKICFRKLHFDFSYEILKKKSANWIKQSKLQNDYSSSLKFYYVIIDQHEYIYCMSNFLTNREVRELLNSFYQYQSFQIYSAKSLIVKDLNNLLFEELYNEILFSMIFNNKIKYCNLNRQNNKGYVFQQVFIILQDQQQNVVISEGQFPSMRYRQKAHKINIQLSELQVGYIELQEKNIIIDKYLQQQKYNNYNEIYRVLQGSCIPQVNIGIIPFIKIQIAKENPAKMDFFLQFALEFYSKIGELLDIMSKQNIQSCKELQQLLTSQNELIIRQLIEFLKNYGRVSGN